MASYLKLRVNYCLAVDPKVHEHVPVLFSLENLELRNLEKVLQKQIDFVAEGLLALQLGAVDGLAERQLCGTVVDGQHDEVNPAAILVGQF